MRCFASGDVDVCVVAKRIHNAFTEVCIQNKGRPAAAALSDFVESTLLSIDSAIPLDTVLLELEYGSMNVDTADYILTHLDKKYRKQWVLIILMTQALFGHLCENEDIDDSILQSWAQRDMSLFNIITVTLTQLVTCQADVQLRFDRSLATRGISGGVATEKILLPPQFVPVTQLVLLTVKHIQERKANGD